jgi:CO/xanthine dehydrogenase Mo-binding subunit
MAPAASVAIVKVHPDHTIEVRCSTVDMGQGSNTVFTQMVADEFGVWPSTIRILNPDTDITPFDQITASQRSTFAMGNAVRLACKDAKRQLFEIAAEKLSVSPDNLETKDYQVYVKENSEKMVNIGDLFISVVLSGKTLTKGGEILGKGIFYLAKRPAEFYTYIAQVAEVEVNVKTGEIKVIKFASAVDVGKAVNPLNVEGQTEGGSLGMGIGSALLEQVVTDNGKMLNPNYADYKLPQTSDVPKIEDSKVIIVETPHRDGPWGAKGVGEAGLVVTAPAIANAIYDAIGVRFNHIPITREMVLNALKSKGLATNTLA